MKQHVVEQVEKHLLERRVLPTDPAVRFACELAAGRLPQEVVAYLEGLEDGVAAAYGADRTSAFVRRTALCAREKIRELCCTLVEERIGAANDVRPVGAGWRRLTAQPCWPPDLWPVYRDRILSDIVLAAAMSHELTQGARLAVSPTHEFLLSHERNWRRAIRDFAPFAPARHARLARRAEHDLNLQAHIRDLLKNELTRDLPGRIARYDARRGSLTNYFLSKWVTKGFIRRLEPELDAVPIVEERDPADARGDGIAADALAAEPTQTELLDFEREVAARRRDTMLASLFGRLRLGPRHAQLLLTALKWGLVDEPAATDRKTSPAAEEGVHPRFKCARTAGLSMRVLFGWPFACCRQAVPDLHPQEILAGARRGDFEKGGFCRSSCRPALPVPTTRGGKGGKDGALEVCAAGFTLLFWARYRQQVQPRPAAPGSAPAPDVVPAGYICEHAAYLIQKKEPLPVERLHEAAGVLNTYMEGAATVDAGGTCRTRLTPGQVQAAAYSKRSFVQLYFNMVDRHALPAGDNAPVVDLREYARLLRTRLDGLLERPTRARRSDRPFLELIRTRVVGVLQDREQKRARM